MRLTYRSLFLALGASIFSLFSIFFGVNDLEVTCFLIALVASIVLVILAKQASGSYNNMVFLFAGFFTLYGLSGPFEVLFGDGLHYLFSKPYGTSKFIIHFSLALIGLANGIVFATSLSSGTVDNEISLRESLDSNLLFVVAIIFAVMASGMEMINFYRVGGLMVLVKGKATYQSLSSQLAFTMPAFQVALSAFSFLALALNYSSNRSGRRQKLNKFALLFFTVSIAPIVILTLILGQRGPASAWMMILFVGITYFQPIRRIKSKLLIGGIIIYLLMGFLFANRALIGGAITTGDWSFLVNKDAFQERFIRALNPSSNEFGAAFGNFSQYVREGTRSLRWGETYLRGLVVPIPNFLYPGKKPKQITYEFRDQFFPTEGQRGSIAGTGFSSILESYINFGSLGVVAVYFVVGVFLVFLEKIRVKAKSASFAVFYLMMLPMNQEFHRSSFGDLFGQVIFLVVLFIISTIIVMFIQSSSDRKKIGGTDTCQIS